MQYKRYLCLGDIHGSFNELQELINKINYDESQDCLISLGDICDRGPDPAKCYALLIQLGAKLVKANHEDKLIRWRLREKQVKNGERKKNDIKLKQIHKDSIKNINNHPDAKDLWRYITKESQSMIEIDLGYKKYVCVHAGLHPKYGLRTDPKLMMRIRNVSVDEFKPISYNPSIPETGIYWAELWNGPETVVFGHNVFSEPTTFKYAIGIDTGCVYGGQLTALIIHSDGREEFISVPAKEVYYKKGD